jgi:hypothetical protein
MLAGLEHARCTTNELFLAIAIKFGESVIDALNKSRRIGN